MYVLRSLFMYCCIVYFVISFVIDFVRLWFLRSLFMYVFISLCMCSLFIISSLVIALFIRLFLYPFHVFFISLLSFHFVSLRVVSLFVYLFRSLFVR